MNQESLLLALGILGSSFFGSWHCAAMCGPVSSLMAQRNSLWSYHLGRASSYCALGILGGWAGSFILDSQFYYLRVFSGILFSLVLIILGWRLWKGEKHFSFSALAMLNPANKFFSPRKTGYSLGFLSVFLPCGWLFTYVLAAIATKSPQAGFFVMFLFWLGGLPAMSALPLFLKKELSLSSQKTQKIGGGILIFASLYSLMSFYFLHSL